MNLLFGSNNKHKAKEIKQIINKYFPNQLNILTPADVLSEVPEAEENGTTLKENAYIKALYFYQLTKIPCFADDTGLEIEALHGKPGVYSARFAGENCTDADNRKKVLQLLKDVPDEQRKAKFKTVICYYDGKNAEFIEGICKGKMIKEEKGSGGFGYDSIFVPDGFEKTFAELSPDDKNKISHRGRATANFIQFLKKILI